MSDAGNILPQAEIDALFKQATGRNLSTPAEVAPASVAAPPKEAPALQQTEAPKQAAPAPPQTPTAPSPAPAAPATPSADTEMLNKTLNKLMDTIETLTQRIDTLEINIQEIIEDKQMTPDHSSDIKNLSKKMKTESASIEKINNQLTKMKKQLKGTPGFNAREQFTCGNCGSHGTLVVPMRCSQCGTEGYWGWWPGDK